MVNWKLTMQPSRMPTRARRTCHCPPAGPRSITRLPPVSRSTPNARMATTVTLAYTRKQIMVLMKQTSIIFPVVGSGVSSPVICGRLDCTLKLNTMVLMAFMYEKIETSPSPHIKASGSMLSSKPFWSMSHTTTAMRSTSAAWLHAARWRRQLTSFASASGAQMKVPSMMAKSRRVASLELVITWKTCPLMIMEPTPPPRQAMKLMKPVTCDMAGWSSSSLMSSKLQQPVAMLTFTIRRLLSIVSTTAAMRPQKKLAMPTCAQFVDSSSVPEPMAALLRVTALSRVAALAKWGLPAEEEVLASFAPVCPW
mmetsp:Transcript_57368/g.147522  ORF Transcript_57368/g.147522 Transcript_57368/m.147522 type:complete len:310 (-) Transcript_57368:248-1177(-)